MNKVTFAISLTGKCAKEILGELERLFQVEKLDPTIRKIVLDKCNDLAREQTKVLTDKVD